MNSSYIRSVAIACGIAAVLVPHSAHAFGWPGNNDEIFPPAAAARKFIDFDNRGFMVNGKRLFIVSGDMHYSRVPRELWRDRLLRIKRAGYNTVQTYPFWELHEPREGQFDFSDNRDLEAFLKLIKELDMYAIVRVGPYVNADADSGGLPMWLRFKPGLLPNTDNIPFYKAVEPYWQKLLPIVERNQITHGGPVIMIQLENENLRGSGTDLPDAYFRHYLSFAKKIGFTVPLFFSGLNHSDNPAGDAPFDTRQRKSPWYSTEFWTGWVAVYGVDPDRGRRLERSTWNVIAYGGAGYTHYEMAGGTSFGTLNCNENASAYDFGSPIGQTGDLRDDYYLVKRAAEFATSFPDIFANSGAAAGGFEYNISDTGLLLTGRQGPGGTVLFIQNQTGSPHGEQIKTPDGKLYPVSGPISIQPGETAPFVLGAQIAPGIKLAVGAARILRVVHNGPVTTIVVHGTPGEPAQLVFDTGKAPVKALSPAGVTVQTGGVSVVLKYGDAKPSSAAFRAGAQTVKVLAESTAMADRTWFVPAGGATHIIVGPRYVGETQIVKGQLQAAVETHQGDKATSVVDYAPDGAYPLHVVGTPAAPLPEAPKLNSWRTDASTPEAQPGFDDHAWLSTPDPKVMGADGSQDAYAWYRTHVHVDKAGVYDLFLSSANDWLTCFVNGKRATNAKSGDAFSGRILKLDLPAGDSSLAFLVAHYGRDKLFNYYGPLDTINPKGITGPVTVSATPAASVAVTGLRWIRDDAGEADAGKYAATTVDTNAAGWADYTLNQEMFGNQPGFAWVRATLPAAPGKHHLIQVQSVDDDAFVYLNGKKLGEHHGVNQPFSIDLDPAWQENGPNSLAILVQNEGGPGGLFWSINLLSGDLQSAPAVKGWRMRGGETPPAATSASWKALKPGEAPGVPAWFEGHFNAKPPSAVGPHPIYRIKWTGLSRGFIWLNGHNLGRYPELSPIDSIYLPECWLKNGDNTLQFFDEDGLSPGQAEIVVKADESRILSNLSR